MIQARISKRYAAGHESAAFALDVEFQAAAGVTVLFGPSGAGKTLILESIAGFVKPDAGRILLDDAILFDADAHVNLPPQQRYCGYVFQNYALFPHMTLRQNLTFGAHRTPRLERHRRVSELLDKFRLSDVAGRRPHEVSGGQKQRCSIARALIGNPKLLLLDEPARGLDAPLRSELYAILRQIRTEFHVPMLLVTHDLEECFEIGEQMIVVQAGSIVQSGPPMSVLGRPASADVARLLGVTNLFSAEVTGLDPSRNVSRLRIDAGDLETAYLPGHFRGDRVWIMASPNALRISPSNGARSGLNQLSARLVSATERPGTVRLEFSGGLTAELSHDEYARQKDNKSWIVEIPPEAIRVL
jgi:molybdate transport system ATP-binding protein